MFTTVRWTVAANKKARDNRAVLWLLHVSMQIRLYLPLLGRGLRISTRLGVRLSASR